MRHLVLSLFLFCFCSGCSERVQGNTNKNWQSDFVGFFGPAQNGGCRLHWFQFTGKSLIHFEEGELVDQFDFESVTVFEHEDKRGLSIVAQVDMSVEATEPEWWIMVFESHYPNLASIDDAVIGEQIDWGIFSSDKKIETDSEIRSSLASEATVLTARLERCQLRFDS